MAAPVPLVIGIDGGGTKTVAWLAPLEESPADSESRWIGRGAAGPGNPRAVGFELAEANIEAAIDAAFADAQLPRQPVASACLALAGCGRAEERERIESWARSRGIAKHIRVANDAEPVLAAAEPENWGIALICGTGSLAWGRNRAGVTARVGGWGYLLGDEGSGYAIALEGLRQALRAADGRGPRTELLFRFQERLGVAAPEDLVGRIYPPAMNRESIAGLAPTVLAVAGSDPVAREVVERAAAELADLVVTLVKRLDLTEGEYSLGLTGGVLLHQLEYRRLLVNRLTDRGAKPARDVLVADPAAGAVALARRLIASPWPKHAEGP